MLKKISIGTPNAHVQIKNPGKIRVLVVRFILELAAFFWNFGYNLICRVHCTKFSNSWYVLLGRQCNDANQTGNCSYVLKEMKWTKRIVTWTLTAEHRTLYFFAIHLNLEQQFADYRAKALTYSGNFCKQNMGSGCWLCLRQKSDNARINVIYRLPPFGASQYRPCAFSGKYPPYFVVNFCSDPSALKLIQLRNWKILPSTTASHFNHETFMITYIYIFLDYF